MKKFILISILMGALPFTMVAQDDDLYFASKKKTEKKVTDNVGAQTDVYHSGSNRSVDEYNRMESKYVVIDNDSTNDIITFSAEKGVYPDSLMMAGSDSLIVEDYALTKRMMRFDDYDLTNNAAFWAGYHAGMDTWNWHTPWYYRTYGWYGGWYDPWYYNSVWSWYDPFFWDYGYWSHASWYGYYSGYYPYGYYGYYPYGYYGFGYYPYGYYDYYPYYYAYGGGSRYHNTYNGNTGTINRNGSTHGRFAGDRSVASGSTSSRSSSGLSNRSSSLRDRTVGEHRSRINNSSVNSSTRSNNTSNSGNFSGSRSSSTYSNNSTNTSRSSSTYSSSSSSGSFSSGSSGGGSFSGGGGGGSRGGGGGGSLGGRR